MAQDIRPPRVDFGEVRNAHGEIIGSVTISKVWFFWLRDMLKSQDDAEVAAAFDATAGVAATGELSKSVDDAALMAQFPSASQQDLSPDIEAARLLQVPPPQQDFGPDIEAVRLLQVLVTPEDYGPQIEAVRLLSTPRAEHGTSAARIAARVSLRC